MECLVKLHAVVVQEANHGRSWLLVLCSVSGAQPMSALFLCQVDNDMGGLGSAWFMVWTIHICILTILGTLKNILVSLVVMFMWWKIKKIDLLMLI